MSKCWSARCGGCYVVDEASGAHLHPPVSSRGWLQWDRMVRELQKRETDRKAAKSANKARTVDPGSTISKGFDP